MRNRGSERVNSRMRSDDEQKYTLGFIFDQTLEKVLLIHKQKPEWQRGKINGVGGKYEQGETAPSCIRRETRGETRLDIKEKDWISVGTIYQSAGNVGVLATRYIGACSDATSADHEKVEWFEIASLPDNVMTNVHWLIPLALEKLQSEELKSFSVYYC